MILSSAHTHTKFCDGANTAEEMVKQAIALGFNALGFSSHSYCDLYEIGVGSHNIVDYAVGIECLKAKYKDEISIYTGLELDALSEKPNYNFDYIIGSVHYMKGNDGEFHCVDGSKQKLEVSLRRGFNGNEAAMCERYYETVDEMLTRLKPDICGHFDLLRCCNGNNRVLNLNTSAYKNAALKTMEKHCKNVIFELNTGGMARGKLDKPYPEFWLLEALCKMGGKIMINSDSHAKNTLNFYFAEAEEMVKRAGFKTVWALGKNGIEEFELQ